MTKPGSSEEQLSQIDGMPDEPREDPAAAVDALERKVKRERGDVPGEEQDAVPAEDAAAQDEIADEAPGSPKAAERTVEPPD